MSGTVEITSPVNLDERFATVDSIEQKIDALQKDVTSLLTVFTQLWEQVETLRSSPMFAAMMGGPKR